MRITGLDVRGGSLPAASRQAAAGRRLRLEPLETRLLLAGDPVARINTGGPQIADTVPWQADTKGAPSAWTNAAAAKSSAFSTSQPIAMNDPSIPTGTPAALFQTARFDKLAGQEMAWDIPVAPGDYIVNLYFSENLSTLQVAGGRVFDVVIEGTLVLDNYDIFADVGALTGVVKSFAVTADANLDIDFVHVVNNPVVSGIEIRPAEAPDQLGAFGVPIDFGNTAVGVTKTRTLTLRNLGGAGDPPITVDPADVVIGGSDAAEFGFSFPSSQPIALQPGEALLLPVTFTPTAIAPRAATLVVGHSGSNTPLMIAIQGEGTAVQPIGFAKSNLAGESSVLPTSLQFGPDDRLYVAQQDGTIQVYTVVRNGPNDYAVTATETITAVKDILNHDDDGTPNLLETSRLVTGLTVVGTAAQPVLYVTSADPRIGGGPEGTDLNLDTNSGVVSRLTWTGSQWDKVDLVRGLPRSEENHTANGMVLDPQANVLYVAQGGNTNAGAPSNNFGMLPEFALSAAILAIDLTAIDALPDKTDIAGQVYKYDLPTLDDEDRDFDGSGGDADPANGIQDVFGGNDGKNQSILVPGGPVQVYAPGFRNPYDIVRTESGRLYTIDNGPNAGWGDIPINEGPAGAATNDPNEPGQTYGDGLHFISGPGYYGGHPNPTRSNPANTFNASNPQSPVSTANPIESDFLIPGVEDGALMVYGSSTNGLVEYTASNFGGAMQGDLLAASFDDSIKRVKLNAQGDAVVLAEDLFSQAANLPLDVTALGDAGPFPGTIWVADLFGNKIVVFEPNDYDGTGGGGCLNDQDCDGYTDADELANGTNPNSAADVPPDYDQDFVSNLTDPDDDNDTVPDMADPFAIDANNGAATPLDTFYTWENDAPNPGGLLGLGFTGLMTNGVDDYESLFDVTQLTAGGAAGVLTLDSATDGTARSNTQVQAFQYGIDVSTVTEPFVAYTRVLAPFAGATPQAGQEIGFFVGTGDQDNYVQLAVTGSGGGAVEVMSEIGAVLDEAIGTAGIALPGPDYVDLLLSVDPISNTVQASYEITTAGITSARQDVGPPISIPASWLTSTLALGVISTTGGTGAALPATYDFLGVIPSGTASGAALVSVSTSPNNLLNSTTFAAGSFTIRNDSPSQRIDSVTFDLSTALFPDLVFDPNGTAGDTAAKPFTADSGAAATGLAGHGLAAANEGGFSALTVSFSDFDPGETFTFSIDVDPTSIQGSTAPGGPHDPGSVSGLELVGSTVSVQYDDGTAQTGRLAHLAGTLQTSQSLLETTVPPAASIEAVGIPGTMATVAAADQTIRVTGQPGQTVRLLVVESGMFLETVPDGDGSGSPGFDVEPFEANSAMSIVEQTATVGPGGTVDIPVVLTDSDIEAGLNYIVAIVDGTNGGPQIVTNRLVLQLDAAAAPQPALAAPFREVRTRGEHLANLRAVAASRSEPGLLAWQQDRRHAMGADDTASVAGDPDRSSVVEFLARSRLVRSVRRHGWHWDAVQRYHDLVFGDPAAEWIDRADADPSEQGSLPSVE